MARYDKYDTPGGFRADLAANWTGDEDPYGVGLDANGHVVKGAGVTGVVGVLCEPNDRLAGQPVDIMIDGEILEFDGDPADVYFAHTTTGVISASASEAVIGFTVEEDRLIVRMPGGAGATEVVGGLASITSLTDSTGGTGNNTVQAVPSLTDSPATADALRDDLVANWLPLLNNNFADLVAKVNAILTALDDANITL